MTSVIPEAPTASPAPRELSLSTFLHVEVVRDLDDGTYTLCAAIETNLGDFRPTSPARALGLIEESFAKLTAMKRMVQELEARDTLAAILAERHAQLEEWDTDLAGDVLRDGFKAATIRVEGRLTIVVPLGQDPILRTAVVVDLVNDLDDRAAKAQA